MARYIAPLSIYVYFSFAASCFASVDLPQDDHPSIVITIFFPGIIMNSTWDEGTPATKSFATVHEKNFRVPWQTQFITEDLI